MWRTVATSTPTKWWTLFDVCTTVSVEIRICSFANDPFLENPNGRLDLVITPLRSLQIPTEVFEIPEYNPKYRLTIFGQNDRAGKSSGFLRSGKILGGHYGGAYHSVSSLASLLANSFISALTFMSTLLTFGAACCFYLIHLVLLNLNSRFSFNNLVLGIPFLTTGMIVFLSSIFLGPCLYLSSHLVGMFNFDLDHILDSLSLLYGGGSH